MNRLRLSGLLGIGSTERTRRDRSLLFAACNSPRRRPVALSLEPLESRCLMSVDPVLGGFSAMWDEAQYLAPLGFDAEYDSEDACDTLGFDSDTTAYFKDVAETSLGDATPTGTSYLLWEHWGGTWCDAEKSPTNTEDDLLCWAGTASNVLTWTGWGKVGGMTNTDQIFGYFQDHWTDQGGLMQFGWDWWFDGTNGSQGWSGWSQEDVQGGAFYPNETFASYFHSSNNESTALGTIDQYLHNGYGVGLGIYGPGGHAITCWGVNYNPDNPSDYLGLWITDSDDSKSTTNAPDKLHYYEVEYVGSQWFLQDYYGSNAWYIGTVQGLEAKEATPVVVPSEDNEISGVVWADANGNGVKESGETGLANQTVYLDANGNGQRDQGTKHVAATNLAKAIPDSTTVTSTLNVSGLSGGITDVNVTLNISHTYTSDLEVYLISPTGTRIQLFDNVGGSGDNFTNTTFDDQAATSIALAAAPFSGTFRPMGSLANLNGEDASGAWTLELTDNWSQDPGTLNSWALDIAATETQVQTDANGAYAFADLADGNYQVRALTPEGRSLSLPGAGYYNLTLSDGDVVATANFGVTTATTTQLGKIDFLRIDDVDMTAGRQWYACQTTYTGFMTLEVLSGATAGVRAAFVDASGRDIAASTASADGQRAQMLVQAGVTYRFYVDVAADSPDADLRLTNLVSQDGKTVVVHGTAGDDAFVFAAGTSQHQVTINGVQYSFNVKNANAFTFAGEGGNDTATLRGTSGADTLTMRPTTATLVGSNYRATLTAESLVGISGGGSGDKAYLYGSTGADTLVADPTHATLSGTGFVNEAQGFRYAYAYGSTGDKAYLHDSAGNDTFYATATYARLYGGSYYNQTEGFRYVYAYSSGGGDNAYLYGSSGSDEFIGASTHGSMSGSNYYNYAESFRYVTAYAAKGGTDKAFLYDSAGNDQLVCKTTYSCLSGDAFYNIANGFSYTYAHATTGVDKAYYYDSKGNDKWVSTPTYSCLSGSGFYNYGEGFDFSYAYASKGTDKAYFYDSAGDDVFVAKSTYAYLSGAGFYNYCKSFRYVYAYATTGADQASLYDSSGKDEFVGTSTSSYFSGKKFYNYASGFKDVAAYSTAGGKDKAYLYDSALDDHIELSGKNARISYSGAAVSASNFSWVQAISKFGGSNTKTVRSIDFVLKTTGQWIGLA